MKTVTITLSDEQHEMLRRLAEERRGTQPGATIAELIREAIDRKFGTSHLEVNVEGTR